MAKSKAKKKASAKKKPARVQRPTPLVGKQPQSNQLAADQSGMYLHTDDAWSLAYFDQNDLHHRERELFGKA